MSEDYSMILNMIQIDLQSKILIRQVSVKFFKNAIEEELNVPFRLALNCSIENMKEDEIRQVKIKETRSVKKISSPPFKESC